MKVLLSIVNAREKGRRVAMVFDIDNTLMDTRHRTAAAATSFVHGGASPMAGVSHDRVGYRPEDTCAANNIHDQPTINAFREHFEQFFWAPSNMELDKPIDGPIALAALARSLGAELYFLTGRTSVFRDQTLAQLERAGIAPESEKHLIMKSPKRDRSGRLESTEKFKARELRKIYRQKVSISAFVTEGSRDMCWLQKHVPEIRRYLFLQFPIDEPGYQVGKDRTVFLPVELELPTREEVLARARKAKL
jgi:phosphoglycolate phosphatase-like HAD superfamily hydrolase